MKRNIPFPVVVIVLAIIMLMYMALSSFAVIGVSSQRFDSMSLAPFKPVTEIVLAFAPTVDVRLVATGDPMNLSWYVMGQFEFPGYIDVTRLVIESSPGEPVRCIGVLIGKDIRRGSDSTTLETFAFGIHAGVLRRVIEKDGMARFIIYGRQTRIVIDATASGETTILNVLPQPRDQES